MWPAFAFAFGLLKDDTFRENLSRSALALHWHGFAFNQAELSINCPRKIYYIARPNVEPMAELWRDHLCSSIDVPFGKPWTAQADALRLADYCRIVDEVVTIETALTRNYPQAKVQASRLNVRTEDVTMLESLAVNAQVQKPPSTTQQKTAEVDKPPVAGSLTQQIQPSTLGTMKGAVSCPVVTGVNSIPVVNDLFEVPGPDRKRDKKATTKTIQRVTKAVYKDTNEDMTYSSEEIVLNYGR